MKIKPIWAHGGLKCYEHCQAFRQSVGQAITLRKCLVTGITTGGDPHKQDCLPGMKLQIKWLAGMVSERTGSCPLDVFDWPHPDGCHKACGKPGGGNQQTCWQMYAALVGIKDEEAPKEKE